jgi:hypothetical protein
MFIVPHYRRYLFIFIGDLIAARKQRKDPGRRQYAPETTEQQRAPSPRIPSNNIAIIDDYLSIVITVYR